MSSIINAPETKVCDCVIMECVGPPENRVGIGHRMVRTDHFKYMLFTEDEEAFFNLLADPYEMENLIAETLLNTEIERHRAMLCEWTVSVDEQRLPLSEAMKPMRKGKAASKSKAK